MNLSVKTNHKRDVIDITRSVQTELTKVGVKNGVCILTVLHTTAGLGVAEGNTDTNQDLLAFFEKIAPNVDWQHAQADHAMDHVLAALLGPSLSLSIEDGKLVLGTWQKVVMIELDGPKIREVSATVISAN